MARLPEDPLGRAMDDNPGGGASFVVERPAGDGLPDVLWIIDDDDEGNLPVFIISDEEEEGEVEVVFVGEGQVEPTAVDAGELIPPISDEEEDEEKEGELIPPISDEEEDEDGKLIPPISDEEEDEDGKLIPPISEEEEDEDGKLIPPISYELFRDTMDQDTVDYTVAYIFRSNRERACSLSSSLPSGVTCRPSVPQRSEESVPSTSCCSLSTKRSREERGTGKVSRKRRRHSEDSDEEPRPSLYELFRDTMDQETVDYTVAYIFRSNRERPRSLSSSLPSGVTCRPSVPQRSEESVPSTSCCSLSMKRSREERGTGKVSRKRRRHSEDSHEEPRPSTSGLGSTTSGPSFAAFRRCFKWPGDSDSD